VIVLFERFSSYSLDQPISLPRKVELLEILAQKVPTRLGNKLHIGEKASSTSVQKFSGFWRITIGLIPIMIGSNRVYLLALNLHPIQTGHNAPYYSGDILAQGDGKQALFEQARKGFRQCYQ